MASPRKAGDTHGGKHEGVQVHLLVLIGAYPCEYDIKGSRMPCKGFIKVDAYKDIPLVVIMS